MYFLSISYFKFWANRGASRQSRDSMLATFCLACFFLVAEPKEEVEGNFRSCNVGDVFCTRNLPWVFVNR